MNTIDLELHNGLSNWNLMKNTYEFIEKDNKNGIITFQYKDNTYHYAIRSKKYRAKGTKKWGTISDIVMVEKKKNSSYFRFGKHIGKTIEEVYNLDKTYLDWVLATPNVGKPKLRENILKYLKENEIHSDTII